MPMECSHTHKYLPGSFRLCYQGPEWKQPGDLCRKYLAENRKQEWASANVTSVSNSSLEHLVQLKSHGQKSLGGLQSMGSHRVGHDLATKQHHHG